MTDDETPNFEEVFLCLLTVVYFMIQLKGEKYRTVIGDGKNEYRTKGKILK